MDLEKIICFDFDNTFIEENTGIILVKEALKYNIFNLPYFLKNLKIAAKKITKYSEYPSILACIIKGFPYERAKEIMSNVTLKKDIVSRTIEKYLKRGIIKTEKGLVKIGILTDNDVDGVTHSLLLKDDELKKLGAYIVKEWIFGCNFEKDFSKKGELVYNGNLNKINKREFLISNPNIIQNGDRYDQIQCEGVLNFKRIC